ncbi:epidermal growth factor receptor substrate 15-like 1 isoform X1 [Juglans microcarpa x Juglans regia]|uniref:epidermal growth factor receptor substrate 15-like 1 isoform X1 n=1 Tax=Juglans microcarpa x Juglans regia TaxID=2249226 RepID=UPI001B7F543A|nr:epidermal growth factor receptor substrate 15-like 1 isoform X1 [Juglans microcarpa x Juglans regia]
MAGQNQGPNMDQFEVYFRRADFDGDGRISGAEAVAFFQGSNLPKQVLAQIWMHADRNKTGFLGRNEFYNALKLVTVAQSKRELTPDIVNAALYGPAAAKIPPPQINLAAIPAPQLNSMGAASAPRMGADALASSQNLGFRAQGVPNPSMNQHYFPSQQNQAMRPSQAMPAVTASHPLQGIASPHLTTGGNMSGPNVPNSHISNDWLSGRTGAVPNGPRGVGPSIPLPASQPQAPVSMAFQPAANASKDLVVSGNGFASGPSHSVSSTPASSAINLVSGAPRPLSKQSSLDSLQSAFSMQPDGGQIQPGQLSLNPSQQVSALGSSSLASPGISVGHGSPTPDNVQLPWPKMKPADVQKYTKVFMKVDVDKDGKITGEEARNLFLSWRLPREVLKQVWDLSDQDNDSMLSLREFCFALYLMERFREGCPLPAALPPNVMFDETLLSMTGQPKVPYGNAAWGPSPGIGFGQQQGMQGAQLIAPSTNLRPPVQSSGPLADGEIQSNQQKSGPPVLEDSFLNQINTGLNSANSKSQVATTAGKKVEETQNVILDSKEKLELYRTKMQELVLYKSRCDNKLNEITERASADKREAELLGKKYEEKYKQVAEIASKLTIEEARLRDIQERKMELHQAIVNMENGGSADGILQVRADRIQSDLEELLKALTERCKKHGLDIKSTALIELPTGWEPGIQEGAALWDEEWDKFEDEGFVNDLTLDAKNVSVSPKSKSASVHNEKAYGDDSSPRDSYANGKPGNSLSTSEPAFESESTYSHSEDELARSPHDSLAGRSAFESPSKEFSDIHYGKEFEADTETHRSFDESTLGAFDNNDDMDSVWGFNSTNTKYPDTEKHKDIFGSSDFGINPVRTGSSHAESIFQTKSTFAFDDSVPGTPMSKFGNSPRYSEAGDHFFDNSSRFDSFSMHDSGFSPREKFTRFDSMSSSTDFGYNRERLTRFDSMSSTKDFGHSGAFAFDDTDPFGSSGPFKVSSESQTQKRSSDNWSAF